MPQGPICIVMVQKVKRQRDVISKLYWNKMYISLAAGICEGNRQEN